MQTSLNFILKFLFENFKDLQAHCTFLLYLSVGHTLIFLLSAGHKANISTANVMVAKACQVVGSREARHTEAKIAAFSDKEPDTLNIWTKLSKLLVDIK